MLEPNDEDIVIRFFEYIPSDNYPLYHDEIQELATIHYSFHQLDGQTMAVVVAPMMSRLYCYDGIYIEYMQIMYLTYDFFLPLCFCICLIMCDRGI